MSSRDPSFPHMAAEAWDLFLTEDLPEGSSRSLEGHLDGCPQCTSVLEHHDPSRLFRRLRGLEVREETWDGFWEGIQAGIRVAADDAGAGSVSTDTVSGHRHAVPGQGDVAVVPAGRRVQRRRDVFRLLAGAASVLLAVVIVQGVRSPDGSQLPSVARTTSAQATPCPPAALLVKLEKPLSPDECAALFGPAFEASFEETVFIVQPGLDLKKL